jgi:type II secretory pathway component PulC
LKSWKDPFRVEDPQVLEMQDKINAVKKEIEFLRTTLEEKKLRREIKELEGEIGEGGSTATPQQQQGAGSVGGVEEGRGPASGVLVKAILITDDEKKALLASGDKRSWVQEGEEFDGWEIKEINRDNVVLSRAGKNRVFFYDRPIFTQGGES